MENHGVQCSKTVVVRYVQYVSFIARIRRPCRHGTTNVFLTTIHGLDHDLMQLPQDFRKENGNVQYCFELEWNF